MFDPSSMYMWGWVHQCLIHPVSQVLYHVSQVVTVYSVSFPNYKIVNANLIYNALMHNAEGVCSLLVKQMFLPWDHKTTHTKSVHLESQFLLFNDWLNCCGDDMDHVVDPVEGPSSHFMAITCWFSLSKYCQ